MAREPSLGWRIRLQRFRIWKKYGILPPYIPPSWVPGPSYGSPPSMVFASPTAAVAEGDSGTKTVTNTLNIQRNGTVGALTILLTYTGTATSGSDYTAPASVTVPAGSSTAVFDVTINGDAAIEGDETVVITAVVSGSAATAVKIITITNDDFPVPVAIGTGGRSAYGYQTVNTTKWRERCRSIIRAAGSPYIDFKIPLWYIDSAGVTQVVRLPDGFTAKCQFDVYTNGTISNAAGDRTAAGTVNGDATFAVAVANQTASPTGGDVPYLSCRADLTGVPVGAAVLMLIELDALATGWYLPMTDTTSSSTSGENVYYGGTTSIGTFGALAANGGTSQTRPLRPWAVIGEPTAGQPKPAVAIGDSNTRSNGSGMKPGQDGSTSASGMAAYGLWLSVQPYSVMGRGGDRMAYWNTAPQTDLRYDALKWFRGGNALLNLGTNDLADVPNATDTVVSGNLINNARNVRNKIKIAMGGSSKVGQAFILPRVTNVNGFLDAATQTVQTGYANTDAARPAYDASLTGDVGVAGRALDFTFNPRALVNDPAATDKWKTDGATLHYFELDGTHLNTAGAAAAAPAYRDAASF